MSHDPGKIKILLAEDAKTMRRIELNSLKKIGYINVIEAEDGEVCIAKLKEDSSIDLIISDWNMPNKSGLELLEWARADEKCKNIPFIMATGQADKKQEKKAVDAGANGFIPKPFDDNELKNTIEQALGVKKQEETTKEDIAPRKTESGKIKLRIAHIQITDHLVLGVLKRMIEKEQLSPKYFELETFCLAGWNPVLQALEKGEVDAACVLAPIAMDLFSAGVPIKLILLAHKSGSIFVRSTQGDYKDPYSDFFKNKSFLIPHKMSVHHMLSHMFLSHIGLNPHMDKGPDYDIEFEIAPPIKMPEFLKLNPVNCGFMVAEPIGTRAIASGIAKLQFLSDELWENHPCCVIAARDDIIGPYAEAVYELTEMLVQAGNFIEQKPDMAAEIAVDFLDPKKALGLKVPILKNVLTEPQGIKTGDLFPLIEDIDKIQQYMFHKMGIGTLIDLEKFIDPQFAAPACKQSIRASTSSILYNTPEVINNILSRGINSKVETKKDKLNIEGKYLTFALENQEYGIDILKIREIIGMMPIRTMPQTPSHIKGVINLRSKVISVMDLRLRFGMNAKNYTDKTCIIILELYLNNTHTNIGIIVDSVSEVLPVAASEIEETPSFGVNINTDFILAMAKKKDDVKTLLAIENVMQ